MFANIHVKVKLTYTLSVRLFYPWILIRIRKQIVDVRKHSLLYLVSGQACLSCQHDFL